MDSSREIIKKLRENRLLNEREDYSKMDHKDLVRLAQGGDQLALETLMREYDPAIEKAASKFIFDSGDSEDAKQIANIGFWEAVQKWDGNGSFGSYANMIMNRKLTDQLRKDSAGKELINSQSTSMDAPIGSDDEGGEMTLGSTLKSKNLSPEEEYLGNEGARRITDFLENELSDIERNVIKKYIQGYKVSEISEETGIKYKSVENALKRVKDKLAEYLRTVKESKSLRESDRFFTDEEIDILSSILSKIDSSVHESKEIYESPWDELDSLGVSEEEIGDIADKLGYTDGITEEQAEKILQYYKKGKSSRKSSDDSDSFEYKGITIRKEGGKWLDSNGNRYMGYLSPKDIKHWIDRDGER